MTEKKSNVVPMMQVPEKVDLSSMPVVGEELKTEFEKFNHEQLDAMKDELVNSMAEIETEEEKFSEIAKTHRDRMKKLRTAGKVLVMNIKREGQERMLACKKVPEFDLGMMLFVEPVTGRVVTYRKLMPNERQTDINNLK